MKLFALDTRNLIATVGCPCGGQTLISAVGASEEAPRMGLWPPCARTLDYPNDLEA